MSLPAHTLRASKHTHLLEIHDTHRAPSNAHPQRDFGWPGGGGRDRVKSKACCDAVDAVASQVQQQWAGKAMRGTADATPRRESLTREEAKSAGIASARACERAATATSMLDKASLGIAKPRATARGQGVGPLVAKLLTLVAAQVHWITCVRDMINRE